MQNKQQKPRLLSGDTSTGRLHLGHWVGSIENRVRMQDDYDCYFLIANIQALTTRMDKPAEVHQNVVEVMLDYLAVGIDPKRSTIFIQSEIAAIAELTVFFSLLVPYPRLMRNPTIKDEIRDKKLGDNYSMGFLLYPISQAADILTFQAEVVPVGEDQIPHLELTREIARRFNQVYCHVDTHTEDADYVKKGGLFPIVETKLSQTRRLIGTSAPGPDGNLLKMSKSLNNAILLSDDPNTIKKKIMGMYTDPNRLKPTDKGTVENNPLWIFHETFNSDKAWVQEAEERYRQGQIGDVECKRKLIDILVALIEPMRERRLQYENDVHYVLSILREGTARANEVANHTLILAKEAMRQRYF